MNITIKSSFYFLHRKIEKLESLLTSKKLQYFLAPLIPLTVIIASIYQLLKGNFIFLNIITLLLGSTMLFMLSVASYYFLKNDSIFQHYRREKSNMNLKRNRTIQLNTDNQIKESLEIHKELISDYYNKFRKIELFNDDVLLQDFKTLLYNCLHKKDCSLSFKLEATSGETISFINKFILPFLEKIHPDKEIHKKDIAKFFQYRKGSGYKEVSITSLSNLERMAINPEYEKIYKTL